MSKRLRLSLIIIVGVLVAAYFLFGFAIAAIGLTKSGYGYYRIGDNIAIVSTTGLMEGNRDGSFSNGDLVFFKECEYQDLKQGNVVLYKDDDGLSVKRIRYLIYDNKQIQIFVAVDLDPTAETTLLDKDSLIGVYNFSSTALGNLARFSVEFSGVIVLYILPSVLLLAWVILVVVLSRKKA